LNRQVAAGISNAEFVQAADASFRAWQQAACKTGATPSLSLTNFGSVSCDRLEFNTDQGNANILMFRENKWPYENAENSLARTTVTYNKDTGEILDADLEINATYEITLDPASQVTTDLLTILTHEIGHFLGIAHSPFESAVMFAYSAPGMAKTQLTDDDIDAVCSLYPPAPINEALCDPVPRFGYATTCAVSLSEPTPTCGWAPPRTSSSSAALVVVVLALGRRQLRRPGRRLGRRLG